MRNSGASPAALVTGATGGLGQQISCELAAAGYRLFVHGTDRARLRQLAARIEAIGGCTPELLVAQFEDFRSVAALCAEVEAATDTLDLLVNNAGTGFAASDPITADGYRYTFQVNYLSPYLLMHRLLPLLRNSDRAAIINIASAGQADLPDTLGRTDEAPEAIAYGRSKLALIMATASLAERLGGDPPRVFALHPGSMLDTPLTHQLLRRMPRWVRLAWRLARPLRPTVVEAGRFVAGFASRAAPGVPSGAFRSAKGAGRVRSQALDISARQKLEIFSTEAVGPYLPGVPDRPDLARARCKPIETSPL